MSYAKTYSDHDIPLDDGWCVTVRSVPQEPTESDNIASGLTDEHWQSFGQQLIKNPSSLPEYASLKASKDGQVILATVASGTQVVCKQCRVKSAFRKILSILSSSKEHQQFDLASKLLACGISTAAPFALIHKRLASEGWLITQYIGNSIDLDQLVLADLPRIRSPQQRHVKNALIHKLAGLISQLQQHHVYHRDFKASNILVTDFTSHDRHIKVWLIDTEGIQFRSNSRASDDRSLVRLIASLLDYRSVTLTDVVRLVRQLEQGGGLSHECWKPRLRELLQQANEYNERSHSRKSHKLDAYQ